MILSGVKLAIANRRAGSLPKKEGAFSAQGPVENIGIILDSFDEVIEQAFLDFARGFKLNEGSAEFVYCLPAGAKNTAGERIVFKGSDISWSGKVISKRVAAFLDQRFDLVVCFTKEENKLLKYLLRALDADLKVGRQQESEYLYDLSISTSYEEVEIFISEVKKYLKILN